MNTGLLIFLTTLVMGINAYGIIEFKKAANNFSFNLKKLILNFHFWIAGILYLIGSFGYFILLSKNPLSIMYPLTSVTYVWVAVYGHIFLDEKIKYANLLGIVSIIVGAFLIAGGRQ